MAILSVAGRETTSPLVIVSRTKMSAGHVCIGAFDVENKKNVRLLTSSGSQQPEEVPLDIGKVVTATYISTSPGIKAPHTEDVRLQSFSDHANAQEILKKFGEICPVIVGSIEDTFSGTLSRDGSNSYSVREENVPNHSVCFWRTDDRLVLDQGYQQRFGKIKYSYGNGFARVGIPFVGFQDAINVIPTGTVARLSLARWWRPDNADYPDKRCQLQLSGWFI